MKKLAIISIFLLSFSNILYSQITFADTLEDIIVLSDKIQIPFKKQNRNIQILNKEEINNLPAQSIHEILQYSAGVDIRQKGPGGAQADIGIDGGTFDQTLILINGIKMSDPQTGHNMMNLPVPIESIERIEILRGPAARIYGVNALMGVINIVTKTKGEDLIISGNIGSSFQKDDTTGKQYVNYGIAVSKIWNTKNSQHLLSAGYDQSNGYRYNTDFKNLKLFYSGGTRISEMAQLKWSAGFINNGFGANNFYAPPRDREAYEEVRTIMAGIKAPINITNNWLIQPYLNYKYGYDHYLFVRKNPSVYENIHHTNTIDGGIDNIIYTDYGTFNMGLNFRTESIHSTNLGNRSRENYGAFLEWQRSIGKADFSIGSYFNLNSVFGFKAYPGIDLGYKVTNHWRLYFNAGMGQRLPTFTDLYYSDPNSIGNELLLPEYIMSYELGSKFHIPNGYINVATFYKSGYDFIDWVRIDTSSPAQVHNFTTIQTFGFNFDYRQGYDINDAIRAKWSVAYTYLQPTLGEPKWDQVPNGISQYAINSLQHQFIIGLGADINQHLGIHIYNRFIDRLNVPEVRDEYRVGNYNLLDLKINYRIKRLTLFMDIKNVANIQYIQSGVVPLPGRWMTLGFKVKY